MGVSTCEVMLEVVIQPQPKGIMVTSRWVVHAYV
jgi:hypothetical protein